MSDAKTIECPLAADGSTSDGFHTFDELYHHRSVLFSVIVSALPDRSWKSWRHHDGSMYEGMFIAGIATPGGQATYHFEGRYWDMLQCIELDFAPEFDGHTPSQAIERISRLRDVIRHRTCRFERTSPSTLRCTSCGTEFDCYTIGGGDDADAESYAFCPMCGAEVVAR